MKKQLTVGVALNIVSSMAFAHPGHGLESAYAGFMHPLTGWDHLLVMLAIGVWASKLGGHARWQLPLAFVLVMAIGATLSFVGLSFMGVETAIAASVFAMGLLLMIHLPIAAIGRICITALFALFHGMAHGVELSSHSALSSIVAMLVATGMLHAFGLLLGSQRLKMATYMQSGMAVLMTIVGAYTLLG